MISLCLAGSTGIKKGHVISFHQDISEIAQKLPRLPEELSFVVLQGAGANKLKFKIDHRKVVAALRWLKENNPHYRDIEIDPQRVEFYQENPEFTLPNLDYVYEKKETLLDQEAELDERLNISEEEALQGDWPGEASYVSKQENGERIATMMKTAISDAVAKIPKKPDAKGDSEPPPPVLPWPKRSSAPANEFSPGFYAKAYPKLFPDGLGDLNHDQAVFKTARLDHSFSFKVHSFYPYSTV